MAAPADNEGRTPASEKSAKELFASLPQKKSGRPVGSTLLNKFKKTLQLDYVLMK